MFVVDSCGWLEYFTDGHLADKYFEYLRKSREIIVPTIVLYEVYKKIKRETNEENALLAAGQMQNAKIIPFRDGLSLFAADLSLELSLPMADAIVYATARSENAHLVTSDEHFKGLELVHFIK